MRNIRHPSLFVRFICSDIIINSIGSSFESERMRGVAVIVGFVVALCAAVAYGDIGRFDYPYKVASAWSYLPYRTYLGHFRAQLQVPPEPTEQSNQMIVYFIGALGNLTVEDYDNIKSGMALIWTPKDHWVATVGCVYCQVGLITCDFTEAPKAALSVEPGDLVVLNITDLPSKYIVGYEISVPYKGLSTGIVRGLLLGRYQIRGVFADAGQIDVKNREQLPKGETRMLKIGYSANINPEKEIPLEWITSSSSEWDQKFVQQGDWLNVNWQ